jgi:hypothetical protein
MTQYVEIEFKPGGRAYTYHHDGEPVKTGDKVEVPSRVGGKATVNVVAVSDHKPPYVTKAIIRVIPPPDEPVLEDAE